MRARTVVLVVVLAFLALVVAVPPAATADLHVSPPGRHFIAAREGFPNGGRPYNDPAPGRHCTVGFGHLIHFGPCTLADFGGMWLLGQDTPGRLTVGEGMALLSQRLAASYEPAVRELFRPGGYLHGKFNQHRFNALASFVFNLGSAATTCIAGFETLCRGLRSGSPRAVADALLRYDGAGGIRLLGLTLRRRAERAMFLRPMAHLEMFPARERRWIEQHDRASTSRARRRHLDRAMAAVAVRIERAARADRPDGWLVNRRKTRHAAHARRSR